MPSRKNKTENSTRKVILEYHKNISIKSYSYWRKKFNGELIVLSIRKNNVVSVKRPTLESQGYKFASDFVEFEEVTKNNLFDNSQVVKFVLGKLFINPLKEVVYDINRATSGRISVHRFAALCLFALAQSFKLPQMLMGQIAQNRC